MLGNIPSVNEVFRASRTVRDQVCHHPAAFENKRRLCQRVLATEFVYIEATLRASATTAVFSASQVIHPLYMGGDARGPCMLRESRPEMLPTDREEAFPRLYAVDSLNQKARTDLSLLLEHTVKLRDLSFVNV